MTTPTISIEEYSVEEYRYPLGFRIIHRSLPIFFILIWAGVFCLATISLANNRALFVDLATLPKFIGNLILIMLGATFMIGLAITRAIIQPNIRVRGDEFQLSTWIYRTHWLKWDEIKKIQKRVSASTKNHHTFAIILKGIGISPLYSLLTFSWALDGYRAFILTNKIGSYERLITLVQEKRPDLFTEWE